MDELAEEVLHAPNAAAAKETVARIPKHMHKDRHGVKLNAMPDVLHAKADSNKLFMTTLLESVGYPIIESVRGDIFWSSGLSPNPAASTKPEYFPGVNHLGSVLTLVRDELMKEAILSTKCGLNTIDLKTLPSPLQYRDEDVTSNDSAPVVNPHPKLPSDPNTSVSDGKSTTASSLASPSVVNNPSTTATVSRDDISKDKFCTDSMVIGSHTNFVFTSQLSTSTPPDLQYKRLASIVDSTKKNPAITRQMKVVRPIKKRGNLVQGTIIAAFDSLPSCTPKRKMSPGKAAETDLDNKLSRSDSTVTSCSDMNYIIFRCVHYLIVALHY